jgi:hypothetical protein
MAIKGLSTFLHAPLTSEELTTYGASAKLSGAIEAAPSINYSSATIYSDNVLKHKDVAFSDGTLSLTVDYADKALLSPLYGRTVEESTFTPTGEGAVATPVSKHISNTNDIPVAQGFGYIINDLNVTENKNVYTVRFFYKIEFSPTMETVRTKEGATTYVYSQLNGTIYELPNGNWMEEVDFDTLAVAIEYLESLFVA